MMVVMDEKDTGRPILSNIGSTVIWKAKIDSEGIYTW